MEATGLCASVIAGRAREAACSNGSRYNTRLPRTPESTGPFPGLGSTYAWEMPGISSADYDVIPGTTGSIEDTWTLVVTDSGLPDSTYLLRA